MFETHRDDAKQPRNATFANPLGAGWTGPDGGEFNTQEAQVCWSRVLLQEQQAVPERRAGYASSLNTGESTKARKRNREEFRPREHNLEYFEMAFVSPEYDVIELHVKRA